MSSSPKLFAGIRVLHRQLVPRHSLYALINLISSKKIVYSLYLFTRSFSYETTTFIQKEHVIIIQFSKIISERTSRS